MTRGDHSPAARQPVEEYPMLREIVAAVQKQQRRTVAGYQHLERDVADLDALHFRASSLPWICRGIIRDLGGTCSRRFIPRCGILS